MHDTQRKRWLWTGLTGSVIALLCCFTPLLVVLLGAVGLGALTGYLDYVLLPALAVFLGITVYGLARRPRATVRQCCGEQAGTPAVSDGTAGRVQG
jgi:mercuric ion transport protein